MSIALKKEKKGKQSVQKHPYVEKVNGVCGGRAKIAGTRFPVSSVVGYTLKLGIAPEELVNHFDHITLAQVYDAMSYYYDHKSEIDSEIKQNEDADYWKRKVSELRCQK